MNRRNYDAVDLFKWLCAWMIMYIHFAPVFPTCVIADKLVSQGICRIAIPFFFATSAFLLFNKLGHPKINRKENEKKLRKYCWHLLRLYVLWSVIYIVYNVLHAYLNHETQTSVLRYIWKFLFRGTHFHLWYLIASLYILPVVYVVWRAGKTALTVVCILGCMLQCMDQPYHWSGLFDLPLIGLLQEFYVVYRALLLGLPLMCLGILCSKNYKKKQSRQWLVRLVVSSVIYFVEMVMVYAIQGDQMKAEMLLSGPLVVYYLINWLFTVDFRFPIEWLGKAMRVNSTWMYCVHMLVIMLFDEVFDHGVIRFLVVGSVISISGIPYVAIKLWKDSRRKIDSGKAEEKCEVRL